MSLSNYCEKNINQSSINFLTFACPLENTLWEFFCDECYKEFDTLNCSCQKKYQWDRNSRTCKPICEKGFNWDKNLGKCESICSEPSGLEICVWPNKCVIADDLNTDKTLVSNYFVFPSNCLSFQGMWSLTQKPIVLCTGFIMQHLVCWDLELDFLLIGSLIAIL